MFPLLFRPQTHSSAGSSPLRRPKNCQKGSAVSGPRAPVSLHLVSKSLLLRVRKRPPHRESAVGWSRGLGVSGFPPKPTSHTITQPRCWCGLRQKWERNHNPPPGRRAPRQRASHGPRLPCPPSPGSPHVSPPSSNAESASARFRSQDPSTHLRTTECPKELGKTSLHTLQRRARRS